MEPIMAKADNYSFLKKLVENVKETKDAQAPDDEEVNKVNTQMWSTSDILPATRKICNDFLCWQGTGHYRMSREGGGGRKEKGVWRIWLCRDNIHLIPS